MLCLRRISLDAKSRLLFLSRSHSSTNDSMPKSTAISRLIHKKFLQRNGNNSPQAIFVFLQQKGLWTLQVQPVLEEKHKSAEDKDEKGKSVRRFFLHLGGVVLAFTMFTAGTDFGRYLISRTKAPEDRDKSAKDKNEEDESVGRHNFNLGVVLPFAMYTVKTFFERLSLKSKVFEDNLDEFGYGFGPSSVKPKTIFEKHCYLHLHDNIAKLSGKEFEKMLQKINPDQIRRVLFNLGAGVVLAVGMYIVGMTCGRQILRTQVLKGNDKSVRRFVFNLGAGVILAFTMFHVGTIIESCDILRTKVPEDKDKSCDDQDNSDAKDSEFKYGFGPLGAKPKNEFEKYLYRYLHKDCKIKWEKEVKILLKSNKCKKFVRFRSLVWSLITALWITFPLHFALTSLIKMSSLASILLFPYMLMVTYVGVCAFSRLLVLLEYDMKSRCK